MRDEETRRKLADSHQASLQSDTLHHRVFSLFQFWSSSVQFSLSLSLSLSSVPTLKWLFTGTSFSPENNWTKSEKEKKVTDLKKTRNHDWRIFSEWSYIMKELDSIWDSFRRVPKIPNPIKRQINQVWSIGLRIHHSSNWNSCLMVKILLSPQSDWNPEFRWIKSNAIKQFRLETNLQEWMTAFHWVNFNILNPV